MQITMLNWPKVFFWMASTALSRKFLRMLNSLELCRMAALFLAASSRTMSEMWAAASAMPTTELVTASAACAARGC